MVKFSIYFRFEQKKRKKKRDKYFETNGNKVTKTPQNYIIKYEFYHTNTIYKYHMFKFTVNFTQF